jgi:hypothetical protein
MATRFPFVLISGISIAIGYYVAQHFQDRRIAAIFHDVLKGAVDGDNKTSNVDDRKDTASSLTTVSFCIGGQRYKVSRSLLRKFPDSILAKTAAKTPSGMPFPICFDRDSERFRYCLEFMRDGRVSLPVGVSKKSLLTELEFYGLRVDNDDVVDESSAHAAAANHIFSLVREVHGKRRGRAHIRVLMDDIALRSFVVYIVQLSKGSHFIGEFAMEFSEDLSTLTEWTSDDNALLNESLARLGLCCIRSSCDTSTLRLKLRVAELT